MKISAINISKAGDEKPVVMELEHYLKAVKVQPDRWKPGNEAAEKIVAKIPMEAVPIGTTPEDVANFEANRGKIAGVKGKTRFEMLLKAAEAGTDITTADETITAAASLSNALLKAEEPDPTATIENFKKQEAKEKTSKYIKEDLMKLPLDKIQAIAETEISDEKMLKQVLKSKKKADLVDSIIQLTKK